MIGYGWFLTKGGGDVFSYTIVCSTDILPEKVVMVLLYKDCCGWQQTTLIVRPVS